MSCLWIAKALGGIELVSFFPIQFSLELDIGNTSRSSSSTIPIPEQNVPGNNELNGTLKMAPQKNQDPLIKGQVSGNTPIYIYEGTGAIKTLFSYVCSNYTFETALREKSYGDLAGEQHHKSMRKKTPERRKTKINTYYRSSQA